MKEVIGMVHDEKGDHFCKLCGQYFTSSQSLFKHKKDIHSDLNVIHVVWISHKKTDLQRHCA